MLRLQSGTPGKHMASTRGSTVPKENVNANTGNAPRSTGTLRPRANAGDAAVAELTEQVTLQSLDDLCAGLRRMVVRVQLSSQRCHRSLHPLPVEPRHEDRKPWPSLFWWCQRNYSALLHINRRAAHHESQHKLYSAQARVQVWCCPRMRQTEGEHSKVDTEDIDQ